MLEEEAVEVCLLWTHGVRDSFPPLREPLLDRGVAPGPCPHPDCH